jgi:hypothetical protein
MILKQQQAPAQQHWKFAAEHESQTQQLQLSLHINPSGPVLSY